MNKIAKYQELKESIKQKIFSKAYKEGDILPSEKEMSAEYGVNRHTIRHALESLVAEGYITKHKGKGSIVQNVRNSLGLLSFKGFSEALGMAHINFDTLILEGPFKQEWPEVFQYLLSDDEKKQGCFMLNRLRMANKQPVMLEKTYLPVKFFQNFDKTELIQGSLFETLLQKYSLQMSNMQQFVRAILPESDLLKVLKIKKKVPLLYIQRKYITSKHNIYIYSELYINTNNYSISNII